MQVNYWITTSKSSCHPCRTRTAKKQSHELASISDRSKNWLKVQYGLCF